MSYMQSKFRAVEPARIDQRAEQRHPVLLQKVSVRRHAAKSEEVRLVDLSSFGCRLLVDSNYKAGDRLWLRIAGGQPIAATAIWCDKGRLGCRFDVPIERSVFRSLILVQN